MNNKCNICNNKMIFWAKKLKYSSYKCTKCDFISILPLPTNEELSLAYNNYFTQRHKNKIFKEKRNKMFLLERDFLLQHFTKGKILDYGCSDALFLKTFSQKFHKYGYEISDDAIKNEKKNLPDLKYIDLIKLKKSKRYFDCVIMRGVIEHFNNLEEEINPIIDSIKKNQFLYITSTPNTNSLGAQLYKENWIMFQPPYHLLYFNDRNLENYLNKKKLKLVSKKFFYDETPYSDKNDLNIIINDINKNSFKKSPAFYGTMMTLLFKKIN